MSTNIRERLQEIALDETARFILEKLRNVPDPFLPAELRAVAMDEALKMEGLLCEFGVYEGRSINELASRTSRTIHGFDSFKGLPKSWRSGFPAAYFGMDGPPVVAANVKLHVGWFADTLPAFLGEYPQPIAFAHLDCDLYESAKTVLNLIKPRLVPGSVIVFDEFFNYPGWKKHGEYQAWTEFVKTTGIKFRYLAYCASNEQVAVQII